MILGPSPFGRALRMSGTGNVDEMLGGATPDDFTPDDFTTVHARLTSRLNAARAERDRAYREGYRLNREAKGIHEKLDGYRPHVLSMTVTEFNRLYSPL